MSLSLVKGGSINLTKSAADAGKVLNKLIAGAGWDPTQEGKKIDLDLMAIYIGTDGKAIPDANGNGTNMDEALLFFNNVDIAGAHHTGDNRTGDGDGDDEQIVFTLSDIPANVSEVAIVVASYSGQTFGEVKNAFVRMVNADGNEEIAKFELTDGHATAKAIELGRIVRSANGWEFKAIGNDIAGDFNTAVASYGIIGQ